MRNEDVKNIIKEIPELTYFGIGIFENGRGKTEEDKRIVVNEEQKKLINSKDEIEKIIKWLSEINKIKTINKKRTSYGIKHIAEEKIGYVSNGAFIAAAVYCGFKYKVYENSPNVSFNMSEKSVKMLEQKNA